MLAATDSAKVQKKKYSFFIHSEAEPHSMYAIYIQTRILCVLQYMNQEQIGYGLRSIFQVAWSLYEPGAKAMDEGPFHRWLGRYMNLGLSSILQVTWSLYKQTALGFRLATV